jgi:CPA2 family monovalent cation:H+ antiporter-2
MHAVTFLQDLAVVMIVAGLVTVIFHRFKQPVVLGYIVAGVIIGPHTPPFPLIKDESTITTLAELGVVFLMFSLGLEFSLRKLKKVGVTAFVAASLEILLMVWAGYETGRWFGWKSMDCLFLGAILSISSTTIIVKALAELGRKKEPFAELIFGILIVEDILAIVMIALLSGIAMTGSFTAEQLFSTLGRLGIFLVVALVLGLLAVPPLLGYVARFKSNEMLLVTVLGLCFGVSLLAVKLNYSVALGAFVIGAVIAEAKEIGRIELLTEPLRDMFSAVFFVAIGMLIVPAMLVKYAVPILAITVAVVAGKVIACTFGAFVSGNDTRTSLRVGMGLAQIGEFSFIIASLGLTLGVTSDFLYPIAVSVSALTTLLTPYLIRGSDGVVNWFDRAAPRKLVNYLGLYTNWAGEWRTSRHQSMGGRLIRKWTIQMALNLALVAGLFLVAVFFGMKQPSWLSSIPGGHEGFRSSVWLCAMVLSLPMLIATYRKLQALGMLLGEMAAQSVGIESRSPAIKAVIAATVSFAGIVGIALFLMLLSSAVLPSAKALFLLLIVVSGVAFLLWRSFIRVHAMAQIALEETLSQPPPAERLEEKVSLAGLIREAAIEKITLTSGYGATGMQIHELKLRTLTGASIVTIEREGKTLVNPGPEESLMAGDQVLLLGTQNQLDAARVYLMNHSR